MISMISQPLRDRDSAHPTRQHNAADDADADYYRAHDDHEHDDHDHDEHDHDEHHAAASSVGGTGVARAWR